MLIKAAVLREMNGPFVIEEVELAEPQANELLIKIVSCGVCHTDDLIRTVEGFTPLPAVVGHEGSGIVEKVGPGVTDFAPGDHVALSFPSCGECENCLTGHPNICDRSFELSFGGRSIDGRTPLSQNGQPLNYFFGQSSFATYAISHVRNAVKIDPDFDLRLAGPLGCGIQTGAGTVMLGARPLPGSSIAIFGVGSVGLSAIMAAKICGCSEIIAIDVMPSRLKMAEELGATHIINGKSTEDVAAEIKKITGRGADFSVETTGRRNCTIQALQCLHSGGKGFGIGTTAPMDGIMWQLLLLGKSWTGVVEGFSIPQLFIPRMIKLYQKGLFPIDKLISFYQFDQINEAFSANHDGTVIKPVLVME